MTNTVAQFNKDLEGFSDRTVDAYVRLVRMYRDHLDRPIDPDAAGKQVKDNSSQTMVGGERRRSDCRAIQNE